ncbi:MAG: hypothetical protein M1820_008741 [Bogoriella megaspora]|nr:MAG: hypothetical protein M1820_008741 [Bogoriella megaspora]
MTLSKLSVLVLTACAAALPGPLPGPQRNGGNRQTLRQQFINANPPGISQATDGSMILETDTQINGLPIRYKISAPAAMFTTASNVVGATQSPNTAGSMGINVLMHGDGGGPYDAFPNQAVQKNLMGVAVLSPDPNLKWGGTGNDQAGLARPQGVPHSQAVADLVQNVLPQMVAFNQSQVFFTGVSGGSLTISGFLIPGQMSKFQGTGVELNCGGMPPQVPFVDMANVLASTPIHFQSTQNELSSLQPAIPAAIANYSALAQQAGLSTDQINALQTANNAPVGGHCAFDGQSFYSGNALVIKAYSNIIQPGGNGIVPGIGNVKQGVVGNTLTFGTPNNTVV